MDKLRLPPKLSHDQILTYNDAIYRFNYISDSDQEQLVMVTMGNASRIIEKHTISLGAADHTLSNLKILLNRILVDKAEGFIIAHNHTSGRSAFSYDDLKLAAHLKLVSAMLDLDFMDSLVFPYQNQPVSMRQKHQKFWSHDYLLYLNKGIDKYITGKKWIV